MTDHRNSLCQSGEITSGKIIFRLTWPLRGNTSQGLTGYKVHSTRWSNCISKNVKNLQGFTGKMSKTQSQLIKDALDEFELDVGDIYSVGFYDDSYSPVDYYGITVEITKVNSNGSIGYTWWGFLYSDREKHPGSYSWSYGGL